MSLYRSRESRLNGQATPSKPSHSFVGEVWSSFILDESHVVCGSVGSSRNILNLFLMIHLMTLQICEFIDIGLWLFGLYSAYCSQHRTCTAFLYLCFRRYTILQGKFGKVSVYVKLLPFMFCFPKQNIWQLVLFCLFTRFGTKVNIWKTDRIHTRFRKIRFGINLLNGHNPTDASKREEKSI